MKNNGSPVEALPRLKACYDGARKGYWVLDRRENWIELTETSLRRHLKATALSPECSRVPCSAKLTRH